MSISFIKKTNKRKRNAEKLEASAEVSKLIIPTNAMNMRNPKDIVNAIKRKIILSTLMNREELLLILFVLSYRSIQVTPISKSMITLNGERK